MPLSIDLRKRLVDAIAWRGDRWDENLRADITGWWRDPALLRALTVALSDLFPGGPSNRRARSAVARSAARRPRRPRTRHRPCRGAQGSFAGRRQRRMAHRDNTAGLP